MTTRAHTIGEINENSDGYFVAMLDNGGVRLGLVDCDCFDFPSTHPRFAVVVALQQSEFEETYDEMYAEYGSY